MNICKTIIEVRDVLQGIRSEGKSIGFVPTMGALHQGHLSLIQASKENCDFTIASIFVNPTQFNNPEDLKNYPKTLDEDVEKLIGAECDVLFLPDGQEIYPSKPQLKISFDGIADQLEGEFRPGHFDGVALVVSKLFNIIQPNHAFFGQKDLQQFFIVKSLVDQLNYPIQLNMVSTARESNGLAMSSRNMRLSAAERSDAALLHQSLRMAQERLLQGGNIKLVKEEVQELFDVSERLALEYFEIINTDDFKTTDATKEKKKVALCIAANIGQVRLIDNLMLIS
ncbi:pantoate--beta-alanine ligase [Roseivirga sp. 4D4]|uniref:pantoate--beta-alanine ligase n=1 Tax=Roseivirga sp. 4D4 TaxID=1889784 RepID=UPI000852BBD4|nr:pantoate--beta-alanine ligase [Roseivirga sp. 4D4]OEK03148.1 pantoate--beta-alanine ligase [Roseivirga sp. 4D4]